MEGTTEANFHEYEGMVMTKSFPVSSLNKIKETAFHDDDIIVATYPKCGTTWMQEIVLLIRNNGESESVPTSDLWQFIEKGVPGQMSDISKWASLTPPRLIKTHMGSHFYEKTFEESKTRFIVVFRNPKDALVSYYHFYKMNVSFHFNGTWNDFFQLFKDKKIVHGDVFDVQLSWWSLRNDPRVEVFKFEDMLKSPEDALRRVMKHLGKTLSDDIVQKIVEKTSFKSMKENPLANYSQNKSFKHDISAFMRKGKVGDWKNYFSEEQAAYVDRLSKDLYESQGLYFEDE